jgi:hypothetical protein
MRRAWKTWPHSSSLILPAGQAGESFLVIAKRMSPPSAVPPLFVDAGPA